MSVNIPLNKQENAGIHAMTYNEETGMLDVFVPIIRNKPSINKVPQQQAVLRHIVVDVKTDSIVSSFEVEFNSGIIIDCTLVYDTDRKLVIFNDGHINLYDPKNFKKLEATDDDLFQYERFCNQAYGEYTINIGVRKNPENIKLSEVNMLTANGVTQLKDRAGILKTMAVDDYIRTKGMMFRYLTTLTDNKGRDVDFLWSPDMRSFVYTRGEDVKRVKTKYEMALPVEGGLLLTKLTKNEKYRMAFLPTDALLKIIDGKESDLDKLIAKEHQSNQQLLGIVAVNSASQTYFVTKEVGAGDGQLMRWDSEQNGFEVIDWLPTTAMETSFNLVEYDGKLKRIGFVFTD